MADGTHGSADPCACSRPDLRASPPETWKHTPTWEAVVKVGLDGPGWWAAQCGGPAAEQRSGQDTHLRQRLLHAVQEKPQEASLPVSIHILSTSSTTSRPRMDLRPSALNDGRGWGHTHIWRKFEIGGGAKIRTRTRISGCFESVSKVTLSWASSCTRWIPVSMCGMLK